MDALPKYVLITPARNEADFIELTLKSVTSQTVLPEKWVIVDDGSTDGTSEIAQKYAATRPWIEVIRMPDRCERDFAGKAHAVNIGRQRVGGTDYEVIGNLDADVSFEPDYFEFLLNKFNDKPSLGVVGTAFLEGNHSYNYEFVGLEHVSGMCQVFRRVCFDDIGGYQPIKSGGVDLIAVLSARAKGWETRTFLEKKFVHHRAQSAASYGRLRERIHMGRKDYLLGNHPTWELFRGLYQMASKPYVVGGFLVLVSYFWSAICGLERNISPELMSLRRNDQTERLKKMIRHRFFFLSRSSASRTNAAA